MLSWKQSATHPSGFKQNDVSWHLISFFNLNVHTNMQPGLLKAHVLCDVTVAHSRFVGSWNYPGRNFVNRLCHNWRPQSLEQIVHEADADQTIAGKCIVTLWVLFLVFFSMKWSGSHPNPRINHLSPIGVKFIDRACDEDRSVCIPVQHKFFSSRSHVHYLLTVYTIMSGHYLN